MIRKAGFVKSQLKNTSFGKEAQNGFDVSLKDVKIINDGGIVSVKSTQIAEYTKIEPVDGYFTLHPGVYSITFNEGGQIPQGHCAWFKTRSSLVRNGSFIESGLFDTLFETDEFGAVLIVHKSISIEHNARVAQLIISTSEETEGYNGQWQGSKDKK